MSSLLRSQRLFLESKYLVNFRRPEAQLVQQNFPALCLLAAQESPASLAFASRGRSPAMKEVVAKLCSAG